MEATQEKTLLHETQSIEIAQTVTPYSDLDEDVKLALRCADEKRGPARCGTPESS